MRSQNAASLANRQRLASFDEVEQRFANGPALALRMSPAWLGRRVYEVALDFWHEIAEHSASAPEGATRN